MSTSDIHDKIKNFDIKTDEYLKQYLKNNEKIKELLEKAEKSTGDQKEKLIEQIERAMKFNKTFKKEAEKNYKQYKLHKSSLKDNPHIYSLPSVPTHSLNRKSTNTKKGGKRKKQKTNKTKTSKKKKIKQKQTKNK
tara:strand:+ start:67 stop:474 length:408 start_codon:yes stop_codon:yes gene_type:complete